MGVNNNRIKKHILVIRLSAMGDVAMTVPVISALTQQYPGVKITILTRSFFKPMFATLPNVTIHVADVKNKHKGVLGLWKLYKELKELSIDAVADVHNVLRSNILKRYFSLSKIPFAQIDKGRAEKKELTSPTKKEFRQLQTTHERYASVFRALGFPIDLSKIRLPSKQVLSDNTLKIIGSDTKKRIGIAPFAAFSGKMYPLELMEEVVKYLQETGKYKILLFGGGESEKEQLKMWSNSYDDSINCAGELSFEEELVLISNLDMMVAMDSGNAHLAAMFSIPTVTLWGVTHPYAGFYPFGQDKNNAILADREKYPLIPTSIYGNKVPEGYEKVMETIAPATVFNKIKEILER
ncbi:MAG: glycosyltransferase family 9 protein [Cellulophaga sp.]